MTDTITPHGEKANHHAGADAGRSEWGTIGTSRTAVGLPWTTRTGGATSISLEATKDRGGLDHVLLHGPPGLGKTTLGRIIANELGTTPHATSGPVLMQPKDLVGMLLKLQAGDVLFIDEIHRLPAPVEEFLYSAMEDFHVDVTIDSGLHATTESFKLQPFTLVARPPGPGA